MAHVKIIIAIFIVALNAMSFAFSQDEQQQGSRGHGRHHGHKHGHHQPGPFTMGPPFPSPLDRGHHRRGPPPPLPFLQDVTEQARREYFDIQMNPNSTKAEVNQKLVQWAESNGVEDQYANFTTTLKNFAQKYHNLAVVNLAGEALKLYNQLWDIRQNEEITGAEECEQIKNALNSTSADYDFVIHSFLPPPINMQNCGHKHRKPIHGRHPFSENRPSSEEDGNIKREKGPWGLQGNLVHQQSDSQLQQK